MRCFKSTESHIPELELVSQSSKHSFLKWYYILEVCDVFFLFFLMILSMPENGKAIAIGLKKWKWYVLYRSLHKVAIHFPQSWKIMPRLLRLYSQCGDFMERLCILIVYCSFIDLAVRVQAATLKKIHTTQKLTYESLLLVWWTFTILFELEYLGTDWIITVFLKNHNK